MTNRPISSPIPPESFDIFRFARAAAVTLFVGLLLLEAIAPGEATQARGSMATNPALSIEQPRVVVLKSQRVLHLYDGHTLVRSYPVVLGFNPEGDKRWVEDGRTPEGHFRVVTRNPDSPYHRFLGIDYPHDPAVRRGLVDGLISPGEGHAILQALAVARCPDWATALGGGIGLHGGGLRGDWTGGCVALSDAHIEELYAILRVGDPVEILP